MSSIGSSSLFQTTMPDEVNVHILSFLDNRSLQAVACTSTRFNCLAKDSQIWRPRTEIEFGKIVAQGAKQPNKSWKQTHDELSASKIARVENVAKVIQAQVKKTTTDRTFRAASALFGFALRNPSTHYYPTGQTGYLGNRKITVFKSSE